MSSAVLRGESEAVARLVAQGRVQMDHAGDGEEGWLHLAARAHRGDSTICRRSLNFTRSVEDNKRAMVLLNERPRRTNMASDLKSKLPTHIHVHIAYIDPFDNLQGR